MEIKIIISSSKVVILKTIEYLSIKTLEDNLKIDRTLVSVTTSDKMIVKKI
jgi:hypothetical protein